MIFEYCVLIFVIESDSIAKTDERYIKKFLQVHYNNLYSYKMVPYFIYTGSNTKYNNSIIQKNIKSTIATIPFKDKTIYRVIYCFDRDRINKDSNKINIIQKDIKQKKCDFVIFSKNIEDCFNPKSYGNKVETSKKYYQNASKSNMPIVIFEKSIEICKKSNRCSNLNIVVKNVLDKIKL